jgi:hypothetical protein
MTRRQTRRGRDEASSAVLHQEIESLSATLNLPPVRVKRALRAASHLDEAALTVVDDLVELRTQGLAEGRLRSIMRALHSALVLMSKGEGEDPLAGVDRAPLEEVVAASVLADLEAERAREAILRECVGVEEVARLLRKSRQAVEALRRKNRILALKVRRQWRYPIWQFDPDAAGGVVDGIAPVIEKLELSPTGVARWLLAARAELENERPLDLLRKRKPERVLGLAEADGRMP